MAESGVFWRLYEELQAGAVSRREFLRRATALGVGVPVTMFILNSTRAGRASAQDAPTGRPLEGVEGMERGAGGELKLLQWQAATTLSPHTATGTKDFLAASLVLEPLMSYLPDASVVPTLVKEVPSVENGLLAEDLTSVTYNLLEGVLWSDGEPFTANDVVFTHQWIMHPENSSVNIEVYRPIASVEAVDDLTVTVTFTAANPAWYVPFTCAFIGPIYPAHVWGGDPTNADPINTFRQTPIGTGPYKVDSFAENDQVIYSLNENYREATKPFFASVNLKGGGDAASTARAVLETGDWDYAWNLQVEPNVLQQMEEAGRGKVIVAPGTSVERINVNFANPHDEFEGERAHKDNPNPVLSDLAVRQALALGVDRATIAGQLYQEGEPATSNILAGIPAFESPNTSWELNVEAGNQLLEEAGWVLDGDVRKKDDVELSLTYSTSINQVRQKTQAIVKQAWEEMGIKVQLKQVDAGIYFDSAPGNDQNISHFFNDVQMYTSSPSSPYPTDYMVNWYGGPDGANIAQAANDWSGQNFHRYANPEYDALYEQALLETDAEAAAELFIQMNDILINDVVVIPQVQRASEVAAVSLTLREANFAWSDFESPYWNVANWNRTS
ncbi:MAG: peptide ABC transporter substrate-binding protein [Thermomicrobiales bacterium]